MEHSDDALTPTADGLNRGHWTRWLAGRYLRTTRRDSFVRFLSWVAGVGIGLGVAALILALSAMTGLQDAIRRTAAEGVDTVRIEVPDADVADRVEAELEPLVGRDRLSRLVEGTGWLVIDGRVSPVKLIGFSGRRDGSTAPAPGTVHLQGIVTAVGEGEVVELVTARPRVGPLGAEPTVVRVRVERSETGEPTAVVDLGAAQRLLGRRGLQVAIGPGRLPEPELLAQVRQAVTPLAAVEVRGWQDLQPGLWLALRLEKVLVFVAVFLIVLVAVLALVADLYLLIADRRREVGILRALGARAEDLRRVFQVFGTAIAAAGAIGGVIVGVLVAWLLDRTGWVRLPGDDYMLEHVPFTVRGVDVAVITLASLLLAWVVCRLATGGATRDSPIQVLHR